MTTRQRLASRPSSELMMGINGDLMSMSNNAMQLLNEVLHMARCNGKCTEVGGVLPLKERLGGVEPGAVAEELGGEDPRHGEHSPAAARSK